MPMLDGRVDYASVGEQDEAAPSGHRYMNGYRVAVGSIVVHAGNHDEKYGTRVAIVVWLNATAAMLYTMNGCCWGTNRKACYTTLCILP